MVSRFGLSINAHPDMLLALKSLDFTFEIADRLCDLFQHRDTSRNIQQVRRVPLRWPISASSPSLWVGGIGHPVALRFASWLRPVGVDGFPQHRNRDNKVESVIKGSGMKPHLEFGDVWKNENRDMSVQRSSFMPANSMR